MDTLRYRVWPVILVVLTGCTDCSGRERRELHRQRDLLIQQRGLLAIQQASIQIAIREDLGGRPPESLSEAEQDLVRASPLGQQLTTVTWQLQTVDSQIESVQNKLWDIEHPSTP